LDRIERDNMSEPINSINSRATQPDKPTGLNPKKPADVAARSDKPISMKDEFILSDVAKKALEQEPSFDREKVKAIRLAIQEGKYPLNTRSIAENFISMESLIGNKKPDL
jgi:negative regulator of flagellin synthesis FlgM